MISNYLISLHCMYEIWIHYLTIRFQNSNYPTKTLYNIVAGPVVANTYISLFTFHKYQLFVYKFSYFSQCFPQCIDACQNHFGQNGVPVSSYSCEGECGLCDLCGAATKEVPECVTYCSAGKSACMETCEKGKAVCISCGVL